MCDMHLHLNGSFSQNFLERTAKKNNKMHYFEQFAQTHLKHQRLQEIDDLMLQEQVVEIIWKKFSLIHEIMDDLVDVEEGTLDVISSSKASYLEIRTSPKKDDRFSMRDYAEAFVRGLENKALHGKEVKGILSIDRTKHTVEDALHIIDLVAENNAKAGTLVAVDISGNPEAPRTLYGEMLIQILSYAYSKGIGIAVHVGESQKKHEQEDSDTVLTFFENLYQRSRQEDSSLDDPREFFRGKVRLGHAFFLSPRHKNLIRRLQIPIEICPQGHKEMLWWKGGRDHPILDIYDSFDDPVLLGTDDSIIFNSDIEKERAHLMYLYDIEPSLEKLLDHHYQFRFGAPSRQAVAF